MIRSCAHRQNETVPVRKDGADTIVDLKELGEFGLIDVLKSDTINNPASVVVGIGDDAAVVLPTPRHLQLLTTDMMVESVHFDLQTTSAWQLGYKAIAVNLSDIAAMGGMPRHAVISIALPAALPVDFVVSLYQGMKEICHEFGVNIVGGDTVSSPHGLVINVAILGEVEPSRLQRRAGAKVGDVVAVTGPLGASACGLELLQRGEWEALDFAWPLVTSHLTPQPQVQLGQWLAGMMATSMDDISDGLASEVNEIAKASEVGLHINAEQIPLLPALKEASGWLGKTALEYALYGGEDYQLLFTIPREQFGLLKADPRGSQLTVIGEVVHRSQGVKLRDAAGGLQPLAPQGYNHFR